MKLLNIIINFSRKNKIFNKSRYSRNRQNVRVIFYFGLYVNIFIIYLIFSLFYNLIPLLSYNWWFYFIFLSSFFFSNMIRILQK
jgi:hypothetical protein